jgi:hypothetical protein
VTLLAWVAACVGAVCFLIDAVRNVQRGRAKRAATKAETAAIYREIALIEIEATAIESWLKS